MSDGYFMDEVECFDYLDAMYNDGAMCESYIEDQLWGELVGPPRACGERKVGAFSPAQRIAEELESTWSEIELLPTTEGRWFV